MKASERREKILQTIAASEQPVSATLLAREFDVSRQIIVGDIALLRASGENIFATPRGYLAGKRTQGFEKTIVCSHRPEEMARELDICVDNGCVVEDVIVDHPVYGQLEGKLNLKNRHDVQEFIQKCEKDHAAPLSILTNGIHLHRILCPDEGSFARVIEELRIAGILYDDSERREEKSS